MYDEAQNTLSALQLTVDKANIRSIETVEQKIKEEIQIFIDEFMLDNCG